MRPSHQVAIVGGGPTGLVLALELGRRGVSVVLFNDRPGTTPWPQANATQARTMEHFRRLGIAERIRSRGLPGDYPTDIAYFTRYGGHELARLRLPSSRDARTLIRSMAGSWSAAELPHRCSQMFVEQELYAAAARVPSVDLRFGCEVSDLRQDQDGVEVDYHEAGRSQRVRARWLVGCDGARGLVRRHLGIDYVGESGVVRDFMGGRMLALHFRCPELYARMGHDPAWMFWAFNRDQRAFMVALNGRDEFVVHMQVKSGGEADPDPQERFAQAFGMDCPVQELSRSQWSAGHTLVARRFSVGRIFLAGDSAHLFTPTGGLGYNTGVDDAVNLGWKLAAVVRGQADEALLTSYELERQPLAERNTRYARGFADSIGRYEPPDGLEDPGARGAALRREVGAYLEQHARAEFNIPGVTLGGRYDGSPIIAPSREPPPPDSANAYEPSSVPGGRAPHVWMPDGSSLYDHFGPEFTLIDTEADRTGARLLEVALRSSRLPVTVLALGGKALRQAWGCRYALIRPDQIVAWRGDRLPSRPEALVAAASGSSDLSWTQIDR